MDNEPQNGRTFIHNEQCSQWTWRVVKSNKSLNNEYNTHKWRHKTKANAGIQSAMIDLPDPYETQYTFQQERFW
jgi:hypothetical protein